MLQKRLSDKIRCLAGMLLPTVCANVFNLWHLSEQRQKDCNNKNLCIRFHFSAYRGGCLTYY